MRYILGFLIGIGLIILLFVMIFRGGSNKPSVPKPLVDYAITDTTVQLTDDYPVNLDQTHDRVKTVVGKEQVHMSVEQGYQGTVLREQNYANNPTAYANFLRALDVAGFTKGKTDDSLRDERGVCPLGHRYIYEIKNGSNTIQRYWSTSCGNVGSFLGKSSTVRALFLAQVPDYSKVVNDATTAVANAAANSANPASGSTPGTSGPF